MKRFRILIVAIFLVCTGSFTGVTVAQERSGSDRDREKEMERAILEQKKAMNEQKKAQEDQEREMENLNENLRELEELKDFDVDVDVDGNDVKIYRWGNRSFSMPDPFIINVPDPPDAPRFHFYSYGEDAERTSWEFSRSVKETTFKKEYSFDVEKTVKSVVMSVNGDCKAGEIRIKIVTPQGKAYSDWVIDEFGNLNVRKSFTISETENQDKTGEWKFQVDSENATGYFKISFQTY